jgi:hypothetical protein
MAEAANKNTDPYEAAVTAAVDYLRGNVKWTLIAFGAIGTTLLAGSQLSSLGKFSYDEPRLWIAVWCALLALGAAAFAVYSAQKVAYSGYTELSSLSANDIAFIERNSALLEGFASFADLKRAYDTAVATRHAEFVAAEKDPRALRSNEIWFHYLDGLIKKCLSYVRYNSIRKQAEQSRLELSVASILAAAALVCFAWAANPKEQANVVLLKSPLSSAGLVLTPAGKAALAPVLGSACTALARISAIVLAVSPSGSEVITEKSKDCPLARITITDPFGKLSAAED